MGGNGWGMDGNKLAVVGVVGLILLSGCAQISIHSTVSADGKISEYQMQINTSRTVYGFLERSAEEEGYDSVKDSILADLNESQREQFSYEEAFDGDDVTMTLTAEDLEPPADSSISITKRDGNLVYEDTTFLNESDEGLGGDSSELSESMLSGLAVDYYLTMPGEITNSNADSVDGNTAEWHETGPDAFTSLEVRAESEIPSGIGVPGMGVVTGTLAFLIVALILVIRR